MSRGFDLENPKDCVDFLDTYQVDRINGRGDYELGNIRLLEAKHNQYLQSQEVRCIRLTEDLWTPCFLIDTLTASPNKHLSKRIYRLLRMGSSLNVSLLGMAQDYLNLYWYDFATPPLEIIENKKGRLIKCKCGDYHKIEKPTNYKCAILSGINYKNSRLMIPTYKQLKESEAVLQKYVRAFK